MRLVPLLALPALLLAGCGGGHSCRNSCNIIFGDGDGECNIIPSGITTDVEIQGLTRDCIAQCEAAMRNPGDVTPGYDPNTRAGSQSDIELHTDKDAALWMDCVDNAACEDLDGGYCAPTKNF